MQNILIVDRNRKPLAVGQQLKIQHCVGPYGQTRIDQGTIVDIDTTYRGVTLKLTQPGFKYHRDHRTPVAVGENLYIPLPGEFDLPAGQYQCYRRFEDFEHGHEAWAQIVE